MTDKKAVLRRRYVEPILEEAFDVAYRDGRMTVSDGLRHVDVVGVREDTGNVYQLDFDKGAPMYYVFERFQTPEAAIRGACDLLYKLRGSDFDPAVPLERFVRELPEAPPS